MHIHIRHTKEYRYSRPVAMAPHTLRVHPRSDGSQRVCRFGIDIEPTPAGRTDFIDLEGNASTQIWFDNLTDVFRLVLTMDVETLRINPFDFILTESGVTTLPVVYPEREALSLAPYCQPMHPEDLALSNFANNLAEEANHDTLAFLSLLAQSLHDDFEFGVRDVGDPMPATQTLNLRSGACRDLAVLFMEICRLQGIASRFVTGYTSAPSPDGQNHLHAWAEVYFPQAGWRGYDPTLGLAVADQHVILSASLRSSGASMVAGAFWGSNVESVMTNDLMIHASSESA